METSSTKARARGKKKPGFVFLILGVIVPASVVVIEFTTRMCAQEFFDPIPTILHTLLVSFVPFANLVVWYAVRKSITSHLRLMRVANGIAMGVACYYTLLFAPLLPLAVFGILFGIGILPLAPLFSFIFAIDGYIVLRRMHTDPEPSPVRSLVMGLGIALLLIVVLDLPVTFTRIGMDMAASSDARTRTKGITLLRTFGNEDLMLRSCYQRTGKTRDLLSLLISRGTPVSPAKAREIYYRITGIPYNSVPPPSFLMSGRGPFRGFSFDRNRGGTSVGGRIRGLSLQSSRIDGSVDSGAALAYLEWTMEFKNDSFAQQEARAHIALPPGGVVSRLTLWINGEEREAAFGGRSKVRQAYQRVVQRRRDPVLVTTSGADRILMQCFPVPGHGGTMKVRIGITVPMQLPSLSKVYLRLPSFIERNFGIGNTLRHLVWVESSTPLDTQLGALKHEQPSNTLHAVRGKITDRDLLNPTSVIQAARSPKRVQAWTTDDVGEGNHLVVQTLRAIPDRVPENVVLVMDGSSTMGRVMSQVREALRDLPHGVRFTAILASDEPKILVGPSDTGSGRLSDLLASKFRESDFVGGQDNVPALEKAWDIAAGDPNGAIVWIHGPQPVEMDSIAVLRQRWERRRGSPVMYEIQAGSGVNRIVEGLDGIQEVRRVPRLGDLTHDLRLLFDQWSAGTKKIEAERRRLGQDAIFDPDKAEKTSSHLVRLWAHDEVLKLTESRKEAARKEAIMMAIKYHLVTPVTGAVVLETAKQYKDAGLKPVERDEVPVIPEPETWLLMAALFIIFLWMVYTRRNRCTA
jgi:hypothetical protein